jgi:hypothetical protein
VLYGTKRTGNDDDVALSKSFWLMLPFARRFIGLSPLTRTVDLSDRKYRPG